MSLDAAAEAPKPTDKPHASDSNRPEVPNGTGAYIAPTRSFACHHFYGPFAYSKIDVPC
jgi:hypothetical protein